MTKIFLTGATGFLGSEVAARLIRAGHADRLVFLGRRRPREDDSLLALRFKEHGLEPALLAKLNFVETDFGHAETFRASLRSLGRELEGAALVHMAAIIHRTGSAEEQARVNIGVTDDLVGACNERGSHFVFVSSIVSFGGSDTPHPRSEKDFSVAPGPSHRFDYFRTKHEAHVRVLERSRRPAVLLCPGIVHGALEGFKNSRSHLRAIREGRLRFAPEGGANFVGLDRVAQAVVDAGLRSPPSTHETRLLVDRNLSFRDYFQLYARLYLGERAPKFYELPRWMGRAARSVQTLLDRSGQRVSVVEGLAQASYWLCFQSEHELPPTEGLEAALKASFASMGRTE